MESLSWHISLADASGSNFQMKNVLKIILKLPRQHAEMWVKLWLWKYPFPYGKVHGANMGPTWVLPAPSGPHVGLMNLAIRAAFPHVTIKSHYHDYNAINHANSVIMECVAHWDHYPGTFYWRGLTLISAWISNHAPGEVWGEITYPFASFHNCTVEFWVPCSLCVMLWIL